MGLRASDVDLKQKIITVRRSYRGPTKSGRTRKVPMSVALTSALCYLNALEPDERIFPVMDPNPMLKALCREARIRRITFHGIRHTFASLALEAGVSPRKVSQVLGHSSLSTTLNIYWGAINEEMDLSFLEEKS
jgi:integrase